MAREFSAFGAHPGFEFRNPWRDVLLAEGKPLFGRQAVDLSLGGEDGIDFSHRRKGNGRNHAPGPLGKLPASCFGSDISKNKEFPPRVGPTCRFGDGAGLAVFFVKPAEPGIGIGL